MEKRSKNVLKGFVIAGLAIALFNPIYDAVVENLNERDRKETEKLNQENREKVAARQAVFFAERQRIVEQQRQDSISAREIFVSDSLKKDSLIIVNSEIDSLEREFKKAREELIINVENESSANTNKKLDYNF